MNEEHEHDYVMIVERKWQTIDYVRYQLLEHSEQRIVCRTCGASQNPWTTVVNESAKP